MEDEWSYQSLDTWIYFGLSPPPRMPVTTRIITFLGSGIPINLHFPQLLGGGDNPRYTKSLLLKDWKKNTGLLRWMASFLAPFFGGKIGACTPNGETCSDRGFSMPHLFFFACVWIFDLFTATTYPQSLDICGDLWFYLQRVFQVLKMVSLLAANN